LLSREVEDFFVETPGLLDRIDRIIDREYGEHDLGRSADPWSLSRMLRALWLGLWIRALQPSPTHPQSS
jgi:hypothetical protein